MRHEFIGESKYLASHICEISVRLIPENVIEIKAIQNSEIVETTETESTLINNYFLFNITGWSILSIKARKEMYLY